MKNLNQSGQAFSVFKLLIAAIVAVFILTFLLQILANITPPTAGDPNEEAGTKVKSLISKLGVAEVTKVVTFEHNDLLSARTISEKSGALSNNEVCVTTGSADEGSANFTNNGGAGGSIIYTGNSTITRKLYVICDNVGQIQASLDAYSPLLDDAFPIDVVNECGFSYSGTGTGNRVCVVSIVPASS